MKFAIGIVTYNGAARVNYLLESISKFYTRARDVTILVSDDCSSQARETEKVCRKWEVGFTQTPEWLMVNGNTNHVIKSLDADVVAVVQDDILISKDSVEVMEQFWEDNRWLRLGSVGWTFFQSWELRQVGAIPSVQHFYPPTWNNGEVRRNAYAIRAEEDRPVHPVPFLEPILDGTPSGVAFTVWKRAWEECGGAIEYGMFEGGVFHDMWDRGWVNLIIPTPPMLHGHKHGATFWPDEELQRRFREHPEKVTGLHPCGEELYKKRRGRYYLEDEAYIEETYVKGCREEVLSLVKYRFDAKEF